MLLIDELRDAWRAESRDHRIALVSIVAIGVALRLLYLWQPMRYDEAATYLEFVRYPLDEALSRYQYPNNHLFHTLLAKAAVAVLGNSPWVLRLPAFAAGVLLVPATYAAVRALYDSRAALIATAIVAASGVQALYATNARGYSLIGLAFLLLILCGARLLQASTPRLWFAFAVIAALGVWTIPVMLYPLGTVCLWLALSFLLAGRRTDLRDLVIATAATAMLVWIAYAPVIVLEGYDAVAKNRFVAPMPWTIFLEELPGSMFAAARSWGLGLPPLVSLLLLGCATAALVQGVKPARHPVSIPLAAFVWCSFLLAQTHRVPFPRVWLWAFPIGAALAGVGMLSLLERWSRTANFARDHVPELAIALCLPFALSVTLSRAVLLTVDTGAYRDAPAAAAELQSILRPGDRIVAPIPTNAPLSYYLDRHGVASGYFTLDERDAKRIVVVVNEPDEAVVDAVKRLPVSDTTTFVENVLARYPGSHLLLLERRGASPR